MKKTVLIFTFFIFSFALNANTLETSTIIFDCGSYARAAASAEMEYYDGSIWEWIDNVGYYFSVCNEAGGEDNMLGPIFL